MILRVTMINSFVIDQNRIMTFTILGISCPTHSATSDPQQSFPCSLCGAEHHSKVPPCSRLWSITQTYLEVQLLWCENISEICINESSLMLSNVVQNAQTSCNRTLGTLQRVGIKSQKSTPCLQKLPQ